MIADSVIPPVIGGFFSAFMNFEQEKIIIISVGGSLIVPNGGIDTDFLKNLNKFIRKEVKKGKKFFLVIGGGKTTRHYQDAGKTVIGDIETEDLDWIGIHATRLNAHLIRTILIDITHPRIIENYDHKLTNWKEPVVVGAGWKPGWSTDYDAIVLARDYGAKLIVNMSNVYWVFDKNPNKHKGARRIEKLSWDKMEKIVGKEWIPGKNLPFDPIATKLAKKLGLTVVVTDGKDFSNLTNIIEGRKFKGTLIEP